MISPIIVAAMVALLGELSLPAGSISGVVVNASQQDAPVGGAEIVLRVLLDGKFVVAAEGFADEQGRFLFDNLPIEADYVYLPGANHEGIHYPGSRIRLSPELPHARGNLAIHETTTKPNPLVARSHHITIRTESDAIRVTETLLIENPTRKTYVGQPKHEGARATTLRLGIPSNFRRTTFEKEFFGRQFTMFEEQLVTDLPWTPGQRELTFTYVLPSDQRNRVWQRSLDLPCDHLRIDIQTETPDEVSSNLALASSQSKGVVTMESAGQTLPAGQVIRLQLEPAPFSLATHGRWLAISVLAGLIAVSFLRSSHLRRRKRLERFSRRDSFASRQAA